MEGIAQGAVTARALWPNADPASEWHTRKTNRQFMIEIKRTKRGEFFVTATPRNPLAHTFTPRTNAIGTLEEAREIANSLWIFMRDEYTGGLGGPRWEHEPKFPARIEPICPDCEGIGTIVTTQQAYGDESICPCGYRHWYSIGD